MTKTEIRHPEKQVSTGAYSAAVEVEGWIYISGQIPIDLATGEVQHGTIQEETRVVLGHIDKILAAAGCGRKDVVKCQCFLGDIDDFAGFNEVYAAFFDTEPRPARSTLACSRIHGVKIEIDAIARRP